MTTIIIQGSKFEIEKTINVLKTSFPIISKKLSYTTEHGILQIVEVGAKPAGSVDKFSDDQALQALYCCANVVKDCARCPYREIEDCQKQMQIDGAIAVNNMLRKASE